MKKKTLVSGPFGIPMEDRQAKSLEETIKKLSKDCTYRKSAAIAEEVECIPGERSDISLITSDKLPDREGEIVIAKGIDRTWFNLNPVVTFAHKYDELPVGFAKWIKPVQRGILAKTIYAKRPETWQGQWIPDAIFSMTQEGILRGKSIGFLPTFIRSPTKDEVNKNPSWKNANAVIESCMLLEYAVAPIPVNQEALTLAVSKGQVSTATLTRLGLALAKKQIKPVKQPDIAALLMKELGNLDFDPEEIAEMVIARLTNRGKV